MHSSFSLLTYEYLHICGSRFRGGIGISSPSLKGLWSKVEQRGGKFEFSSLWHFANISGCHLDETKSHALYLDIWKYKNTKNMIVVPYCSTASLMGLPCWQQPNENLEHRFCIFLSWAERFPFWLPFFYHVSLQHLKKKIPSYILFPLVPSHLSSKLSFTFWLILFFCMKRRSFWRRREQRARERERTRAALCHSFVLRLKGLLAGLITMWAALWRSAASFSEGCQTLFPFFYCGQSWGKIFKRRGKVAVYSGAMFVFVQLCILALRGVLPTCTEF